MPQKSDGVGCLSGCGGLFVILAGGGFLIAHFFGWVRLPFGWVWTLIALFFLAIIYFDIAESVKKNSGESRDSLVFRIPHYTFTLVGFAVLAAAGIVIFWWIGDALAGVSATTVIIILLIILIIQNASRR